MSQFSDLIPQARIFLAQLAANNDRDWFAAHKGEFEARIKRPALAFADLISADLARLLGRPVTHKLFRIHRDLRFSADKTPYNTHLHLAWTADGKTGPGWYFGLSPDDLTTGWGWMAFTPAQITTWRQTVDSGTCPDLPPKGFTLAEPELKRVPAPYDKTHPAGDNLRRKSLTLWREIDPAGDPHSATMANFTALLPLHQALAPRL